jgi:hypothetical protein
LGKNIFLSGKQKSLSSSNAIKIYRIKVLKQRLNPLFLKSMRLTTRFLTESWFSSNASKNLPDFSKRCFLNLVPFQPGVAEILKCVGKKYFYSASKVCPPVFLSD